MSMSMSRSSSKSLNNSGTCGEKLSEDRDQGRFSQRCEISDADSYQIKTSPMPFCQDPD